MSACVRKAYVRSRARSFETTNDQEAPPSGVCGVKWELPWRHNLMSMHLQTGGQFIIAMQTVSPPAWRLLTPTNLQLLHLQSDKTRPDRTLSRFFTSIINTVSIWGISALPHIFTLQIMIRSGPGPGHGDRQEIPQLYIDRSSLYSRIFVPQESAIDTLRHCPNHR
jgi:hypothetical protein